MFDRLHMMAATTESKGGLILYDDILIGHPDPRLFAPAHWRGEGRLEATAAGRGASWLLHRDDGDWVLRHYRRGGAIRFLDDRYGWPGAAARTRPFREWHYLAELRAADLPVPRPVAARVCRTGLIYRGDLITERIDAAQPLSTWLKARDLASPPWPAIGRTLARFHAVGAAHPDLNAHNILIQPNQTVWLIDFDRGDWRRPDAGWTRQNLARLKRSLLKIAAAADAGAIENDCWPALLEGYQ